MVCTMLTIKGQKALGADALRIWVASVDYAKDVSIGPTSIAQAAEILRKIRSVMRFVLGNLSDRPAPNATAEHDLVNDGAMVWADRSLIDMFCTSSLNSRAESSNRMTSLHSAEVSTKV